MLKVLLKGERAILVDIYGPNGDNKLGTVRYLCLRGGRGEGGR